MLGIAKRFEKTYREVCDLYTMVSGDVEKISLYYEGAKVVSTWSALEDMALMEPDTSVEYQVLLQEKGWKEISDRKKFLAVRPIFEQENIEERNQ